MNYSEILDKDILQFYYEILACPMRDAAPEIDTESGTRFVFVKELRRGNSKKVSLSLCFASDNECAAQPITARQIYEYMQAHSVDILHVFGGVCELHKAYGEMLQAVVKEAQGEEIASNWGESWRNGFAGIFDIFCSAARCDSKGGASDIAWLHSLWDLIAQGASTPDANAIDIEANRGEVQRFCRDELRPFLAGESSAEPTTAARTETPDLQEIRKVVTAKYLGFGAGNENFALFVSEISAEVARIADTEGRQKAVAVLLLAYDTGAVKCAFAKWLRMWQKAMPEKLGAHRYKPRDIRKIEPNPRKFIVNNKLLAKILR